ncbi:MAG: FkbM family methyltransferase [Betaproteobacteria bacterium]|nr:FkbM family methyltransferase [Betaproteobacteria bacterium]
MQFGPLTLKRCRYGWMLYSGPFIGKCFELYGQYSEAEVRLMRNFVPEGATVVDVGANIGDLTLPLAGMVGERGRVYAIESHADNFNVLCANLALNQVRNTMPVNAFVSRTADVDTGSATWGPHAYVSDRWKPKFVALDDLGLEACDLIKVDVDGKELEVLESGAMLIEQFRPVLYFEDDVREVSEPLLEFVMKTLGYDAYRHPAPIWEPENFFGNPVNHWAPKNMVSLMVVGIPRERKVEVRDLHRISRPDEWWELE